jgi:hypothetical protein
MFGHRLTANGRKIAADRYQFFIEKGCNPSHARNAAEVLTLESETDYQRTKYDQQAISNCWETLNNGDDAA